MKFAYIYTHIKLSAERINEKNELAGGDRQKIKQRERE